MTDPDWEPIMKKAAAIVTDRGGRTCHAAIVARELGIPAIVGTGNATRLLQRGAEVTVSCVEGDTGHVYAGAIPIEISKVDLASAGPARKSWSISATPILPSRRRCGRTTGSAGAWNSSSASISASIDGPRLPRKCDLSGRPRGHRAADETPKPTGKSSACQKVSA
jgi:hypothetical protein